VLQLYLFMKVNYTIEARCANWLCSSKFQKIRAKASADTENDFTGTIEIPENYSTGPCPICKRTTEAIGQVFVFQKGKLIRTDNFTSFQDGWIIRFVNFTLQVETAGTNGYLTAEVSFDIRKVADKTAKNVKTLNSIITNIDVASANVFSDVEITLPPFLKYRIDLNSFNISIIFYCKSVIECAEGAALIKAVVNDTTAHPTMTFPGSALVQGATGEQAIINIGKEREELTDTYKNVIAESDQILKDFIISYEEQIKDLEPFLNFISSRVKTIAMLAEKESNVDGEIISEHYSSLFQNTFIYLTLVLRIFLKIGFMSFGI
jgi:hypothetical protein